MIKHYTTFGDTTDSITDVLMCNIFIRVWVVFSPTVVRWMLPL